MNKNIILQYAIVKYPIGTHYYPVSTSTGKVNKSGRKYCVKGTPIWIHTTLCANGNIYHKGVWAEIINPIETDYETY